MNKIKNLYRHSGKMSRKTYLITQLVVLATGAILLAGGVYIGVSIGFYSGAIKMRAGSVVDPLFFNIVLMISMVPSLVTFAAIPLTSAQRMRDIGLSGWAALSLFFPYLGILIYLALFVIPGQRRAIGSSMSSDAGETDSDADKDMRTAS